MFREIEDKYHYMNNRISTIYFSPTQTTKKIVETVANGLGDNHNQYNLTLPSKREKHKGLTFGNDDIVIIGVPVYKGRIPEFLNEYFSNFKGNDTKAIFIVTYGNRAYDDALLELKNIFEKRGFKSIAAGAFIGEHSNTTVVATNRPDAKDLDIALKFAKTIKYKIDNSIDFTTHKLIVKGNYPYKETPKGPIMLPETNEQCTDCAICANTCPMGAIDFVNYRDIDSDKCIKCCNCVKICPVNAKTCNDKAYIEFTHLLINQLTIGRKEPEVFFI